MDYSYKLLLVLKNQFWRGLQELGSGRIRFLGTVQYFGHLKGLKGCIVPKEPIPAILERSSKGWPYTNWFFRDSTPLTVDT